MLTTVRIRESERPSKAKAFFPRLRRLEFGRLDATGQAYLDYTGSALYAERQVRAHGLLLRHGVYGNPHSESTPSLSSTSIIESARGQVLQFLDAPGNDYAVCFTANTSAAIKLVAESFPFGNDGCLVLSSDNHNSMNGAREYAARAGASVSYLPLDDELRLADPQRHLRSKAAAGGKLFGLPAQSNFSGVKHPMSLATEAQRMGYAVLLDAAAFVPTNRLSLREFPVDFVALSMYKIFGFPTGVGALVARRDSLQRLRRPWFSGGTVDYVSVQNDTHALRNSEAGFEDGTPSFLDIGALNEGFSFLRYVGMERINSHVMELTSHLLEGLQSVKLSDGSPAVRIYGPSNLDQRGATIAFNIIDRNGQVVPYWNVEAVAREAGVAIRGGCFCNPGASEAAFGFPAGDAARCLREASVGGFTVERFAHCLGPAFAVGAVRVSPGLASNREDVNRLLTVVKSFA